jgi:hypothetical protein
VSVDDEDVPIGLEGRMDGGENEPAIVELDGRGVYRADIRAISAPGGG